MLGWGCRGIADGGRQAFVRQTVFAGLCCAEMGEILFGCTVNKSQIITEEHLARSSNIVYSRIIVTAVWELYWVARKK